MKQVFYRNNLKYLPTLVMLLVIGFQLSQVYMHKLSPWRGGGFGMYSTIHHNQRKIRVTLYTDSGEPYTFISYTGEWGIVGDKARIYPHPSYMKDLAQQIHEKDWVYFPNTGGIRVADTNERVPSQYHLKIDSTQIDIWEPKLLDKPLNIGINPIKSTVYK